MRGPAIIERKLRLDGTHVDFACERLLLDPGKRAVLRYVVDRPWHVAGGELVVPEGTVTIAHYWMDRPYNVYHWVEPDATAGAPAGAPSTQPRTIAYYCNVAEAAAIQGDLVAYTDLVVDVLIDTAGRARVLDEDELPADLDPARRRLVARALDELTSHPRRLVAHIEKESRPFLAA